MKNEIEKVVEIVYAKSVILIILDKKDINHSNILEGLDEILYSKPYEYIKLYIEKLINIFMNSTLPDYHKKKYIEELLTYILNIKGNQFIKQQIEEIIYKKIKDYNLLVNIKGEK